MTVYKLRYFMALCDTGSYTKAAELSFISQPAFSIAIRNLEAELGVQLFEKDGNSVALTEAGKRLYPLINRVLSDVNCLHEELNYIAGTGYNQITLGAPPDIDPDLLISIQTRFCELERNVDVHIVQYAPGIAEHELSSGNLDLCFLPKPVRAANISYADYLRQELRVYVAKTHPFFQAEHITPSMLSAEMIINSDSGNSLMQCVRRYAKANGVAYPRLSGDVCGKKTAIHMLDGKRVAIFPISDSNYDTCRQVALDPPLYQDFVLAWRNDVARTSVQTRLQDFILGGNYVGKSKQNQESEA